VSTDLLAKGEAEQNCGQVKTGTHFAHRIDMLDAAGEVTKSKAVWREAIARRLEATIILRQGARVVHHSRRPGPFSLLTPPVPPRALSPRR
jgi:hypothetical protein